MSFYTLDTVAVDVGLDLAEIVEMTIDVFGVQPFELEPNFIGGSVTFDPERPFNVCTLYEAIEMVVFGMTFHRSRVEVLERVMRDQTIEEDDIRMFAMAIAECDLYSSTDDLIWALVEQGYLVDKPSDNEPSVTEFYMPGDPLHTPIDVKMGLSYSEEQWLAVFLILFGIRLMNHYLALFPGRHVDHFLVDTFIAEQDMFEVATDSLILSGFMRRISHEAVRDRGMNLSTVVYFNKEF